MTGGEQAKAFVPDAFDVPRELVTPQFRLEPLGPQHNADDYEAWTSSIDHIRATPGFPIGEWPVPGMTPEENLADLRRHAADFAHRSGFTYTVLEADSDRVIGCVYIYPSRERSGVPDAAPGVGGAGAELARVLQGAVPAGLPPEGPFTGAPSAPRPPRHSC